MLKFRNLEELPTKSWKETWLVEFVGVEVTYVNNYVVLCLIV